jgi:hypothetical protein
VSQGRVWWVLRTQGAEGKGNCGQNGVMNFRSRRAKSKGVVMGVLVRVLQRNRINGYLLFMYMFISRNCLVHSWR